MRKILLVLVLLSLTIFAYGEKVSELEKILKPGIMISDGENLFIAQELSIYNYSLKTYQLQAKFVEKGQGPGEIVEPPYMALLPEKILVYSDGKCLWYTKDGKLQKELRIARENVEILPVKDGYVSSRFFPAEEENLVYIRYFLLDNQFKSKKQVYETVFDVNVSWGGQREAGFKNYKMITHFVGVGYQDEKIFIADSSKGFNIDVYDLNGQKLYTIQKDNEVAQIEVEKDYKEKLLDEFKSVEKRLWPYLENNNYRFYKYYPHIRNFFITDGKIYILTYKREKDKKEIIVLDLKGKILKRALLPLQGLKYYIRPGLMDSLTIKNSKVYELVENQDKEIYELHIHEIK